ncbi:uncharacterized protein PV09_01064 [Verruconis gallopava]|uniref:tyrosinase n=1 Tax=Verruconis gallopava TaxID=253628 RepID=A0A0D2ANN3_9PEZI|nr:uncharacterized protein PV09_01064 [Verruconis gallopava]KIW08130.1 hypothetical protein PV09_01064 [Verruconis gallopava]
MTDHYDIKGIPVKGSAIPERTEFNTWATNDPESNIQVSLMIRALQRFYKIPIEDRLSYFQIAGIHGYPAISWDASPEPAEKLGRDDSDKPIYVYCTHSTIRFPTWHRPYMLLFEQRVHELMLEAIDALEFKLPGEKEDWIAEAYKWRLPYWDWARNPQIPDLFKDPMIKIRLPRAVDGSLPPADPTVNPLWRYECLVDEKPTPMGELPAPYAIKNVRYDRGPEDFYPWAECSGTSRWSVGKQDYDWKAGYNYWQGTDSALRAHDYYTPGVRSNPPIPGKESISDLVYRMMTTDYFGSWRTFSTTKYTPKQTQDWTSYLSLEYIHNNLHGFIGGGDTKSQGFGHMESVPVASFDPIFYFHHCNIDRQLAIWQTLHPNNWFDGSDVHDPKSSDPLFPFWHRDENSEWRPYTSNDIQAWTKLGYQYDVLARRSDEDKDDDKYLDRIKAYVDSYKSTSNAILNSKRSIFGNAKLAPDTYPDYIVDVLYDRHGNNGYPYYIYFFLGRVADADVMGSESLAAAHPQHVGTIYTFSSSYEQGECANCDKQKAEEDLCTAQIALTSTLIMHAKDTSIPQFNTIDLDSVTAYLSENLTWKAVSVNGQIIPAADLPSTKVFVLHGKGQHFPEPEKLSEYSDYQPLPQATEGKDWGAAHHEY